MNLRPCIIQDRLYGEINYTSEDLRLFQTRELTHLRRVSLSAVPPWCITGSMAATKFEHSVGVGHLAKIIGSRLEFKDISQNLLFAAYSHDIATPPFSHLSEMFLIAQTGKDHEQFADDIFDGSEFAQEVARQGGSVETVLAYIKGEDKPFSDIINGTIDLDNLDNTLRFGLSVGILQALPYSPEKLAEAYAMRGQQLILEGSISKHLSAWEQCRQDVYGFVYSDGNYSPAAMLVSALYFAAQAGELPPHYFRMTDNEAFDYLGNNCNKNTSTLIERMARWQFYDLTYTAITTTPSKNWTEMVNNSMKYGALGEEIAHELKVEPIDVCVKITKDKGHKKIHLPIHDKTRKVTSHTPQKELTYMVHVFTHPNAHIHRNAVKEIIEDKLL